jgi:peptidoglycan biosynthesis protein MviN/MurJ (putative lipid II flippase)
MNITLILQLVIGAYLMCGVGFAIAAWLEAAEREVDAGNAPPSFLVTLVYVVMLWLFIAIYCYRAEVLKTIKKIDD